MRSGFIRHLVDNPLNGKMVSQQIGGGTAQFADFPAGYWWKSSNHVAV